MSRLSATAAQLLWRYRTLLCVGMLAITVFAAQRLVSIQISNSLEIWYPQDDPELVSYREFQNTYGSDEIIVVAVQSNTPNVFVDADAAEFIGELTDYLLDIEGVANVTSRATVPESLATERGRLLSADGQTTALIVQTLVSPEIEAQRPELLQDIREIGTAFNLRVHLGGYGVVFEGLNDASTRGAAYLIAAAHFVMILLLVLFFRNVLPALVTMLAVGIATVWTLSIYVATGHQLNLITMVLPTLILVIGIADCMHIFRCVARQPASADQRRRVVAGLEEIMGTCGLTTITTAAGFLALTVSGMPVIQQLGWFGALGVAFAFVVSLILATTALSWKKVEPSVQATWAETAANSLFAISRERPRAVFVGYTLVTLLAAYGLFQLKTDTHSIAYLNSDHEVRRDSDFIEREIGAYVPVEFTVTATDGDILTGRNLDAIWRWQMRVAELAEVRWTWSLLNGLGLTNKDIPSNYGIDLLRQRYSRMQNFSPVTLSSMIDGSRQLRIAYGAPVMSAVGVRRLIKKIQDEAQFPVGLTLAPAGYSPLYTRIVDEIVSSQIYGFGAAIVIIGVLMGAAMRSWRRVLLALPANAIPVALTVSLMGLTGIPLDVATATIAGVILGLVVDDSVHLLKPASGASLTDSLDLAGRHSGGTLIMTSVVLAGGFLVLGLAEIRSIAWFGFLASFGVIVAILSDLLLLPALARVFSGTEQRCN